MSSFKSVVAVLVLVVTFLVLFTVAGQVLLPAELLARAAADHPDPASAAGALLLVACIDITFMLGVVLSSRLRGWHLWLLTAAVYWGAKTFTSQLEAWYFMPNVSAKLVPALMLMTVPVALVVPLLTVVFFGRWSGPEEQPAWQVPPMGATQQVWKWFVLSAVVYPVLFFVAGYYVAFSSEAVRAFYGGVFKQTFFEHMSALISGDPKVIPFEVLRGALWVALAVAILWTTRGRGWVGGVLVVLLFSLVQNDVHFLHNPLMPEAVRRFHFIETASSNAVFAALISWLMTSVHFSGSHRDRPRPATPGQLSNAH